MRSLTVQLRMGCKSKVQGCPRTSGQSIESYCCGKDVFLSAPTGFALSISLCVSFLIGALHRETLANWASPFGLFLRSSPTLKIQLLVSVPLRSA